MYYRGLMARLRLGRAMRSYLPSASPTPLERPSGSANTLSGRCSITRIVRRARLSFFSTLLFKIFNKVETRESLEQAHAPLTWEAADLDELDRTLTRAMARGRHIYSAYIMQAPGYGADRKHTNHLKLLAAMIADRLPDRLRQAPDLRTVYEKVLSYPRLGASSRFSTRSTSTIPASLASTRTRSWSPGRALSTAFPNASHPPVGSRRKNSSFG